MRIYVAGKFEEREEIRLIYNRLEELGHTIVYDWTKHSPIKPYHKNQDLALEYCEEELEGILNCDVFIGMLYKKGTTLLMEIGAAIMLAKYNPNIKIYIVGEYNTSSPWLFNSLIRRRDSIDEVIEELSNI
ncbi:MAG: hypothetical protein ACLFPL_04175 [Candidatus Nanoarchaeia archaeon]